jgi:hypothetical protein
LPVPIRTRKPRSRLSSALELFPAGPDAPQPTPRRSRHRVRRHCRRRRGGRQQSGRQEGQSSATRSQAFQRDQTIQPTEIAA